MIISHKYKFIFIKTVKTAGTSLEVFLSQCCGEEDIVTPITPHIEPHRARNYESFWNPIPEIMQNGGRRFDRTIKNFIQRKRYYSHITALLAKQRTPRDIWNSYFKFCIERNPWDKTLSHYHMVNNRTEGGISFDKYIEKRHFCFNFHKYTDVNGHALLDKVVKYESLMSELDVVFQQLGIPFDGTLGVKAKSEHRTDRRPYQDVFSETQRNIIQTAFRNEIEMHGYKY